jgi:methylmalonyl-CoA/ethylmalonyl-CoA epimerase
MTTMAKLRHIAVTVPDPEATATFYEKTFGMERVYKSNFGVLMSDGTVSLAILRFPTDAIAGDERGKDFFGLHHMGFVVDDIDAARKKIEANGGRYHMKVPSRDNSETEEKYRDPNGVVFDIVTEEYATGTWKAK